MKSTPSAKELAASTRALLNKVDPEKFEQPEPMPGSRYPKANAERITPDWFKKLPNRRKAKRAK